MVSVTLADADAARTGLIERVEAAFSSADARFSRYRPDSELSRVVTGELALLDASEELTVTYAEAIEWRGRTDGAFSPHRPDGSIDLDGIVKSAAMRTVGELLDREGCHDWSLVVGGDQLVRGSGPDGLPWITGIVDPADRAALLCSIAVRAPRRAVASSGSAERGDHIWTVGLVPEFVQVTVVADDIVTADVLATAIVAGGAATLDAACERWPIDVLTVDRAGELRATSGFRAALATP
ncbi:FAD:protein FMN transferase [Lysinimonas soli]|uniref:FAD:protein FMN transferase n=1 Tax=Lysinimonas soli TaxID=1074233 RepID=A0ABW0NSC5_9MICO